MSTLERKLRALDAQSAASAQGDANTGQAAEALAAMGVARGKGRPAGTAWRWGTLLVLLPVLGAGAWWLGRSTQPAPPIALPLPRAELLVPPEEGLVLKLDRELRADSRKGKPARPSASRAKPPA